MNTTPKTTLLFFVALAMCCALPSAQALELDQMSLDRWKVLREVERYQLNIAERYYKEKNWKVAQGEYEKYLTLYEDSEAASYVQLKWSLCMVNQRKGNTAIKEGFQSVIDYWPESPEAPAAAYFIAHTHKATGRIPNAKKAYRIVLQKHADSVVGVRAMMDLVDISMIEDDEKTRVQLWTKLVFEVKRTDKTIQQQCAAAASALAVHHFGQAAFDNAVKALATNYEDGKIPPNVVFEHARGPIQQLARSTDTKAKGDQLTGQAAAWMRQQMPTDLKDEEQAKLARQMWYHIADLHAYAQLVDQVPKIYQQINGIFGPQDETLKRLGDWYKYSQKQFDKARSIYRQFSDKVVGLSHVAYSYREQQKPVEAVAIYNQMLGLAPDDQVRWKAEIAATYRAAAKYDDAIGVYRELVSQDPERANDWRWQISLAYRDAKKYKEAIANFQQCTNFPENYKQMAYCQLQLKKFNEAILLYNQVVVGHEPSAAWGMLQVAYTREKAGQKEQAIKTFQQVCKRYPKNQHASVAHAHLQTAYGISITLGGAQDDK